MTDFHFVNTDNFDLKPITGNHYHCAICDCKLNDICLADKELESFKTKHGFSCNVCYRVYRNVDALKEHQIDHFTDKDLKVACIKCTNASKKFDSRCGVLEIGQIYTKNDVRSEFHCELCDRCFDGRNQYLQHVRDHFDRTVYVCDHCNGIKIVGWERWNIHKTTAHEETEPATLMNRTYKCSVCATVIQNISEFQKHLSNCQLTNGEKPISLHDGDSLYCGVCCVEMPDIQAIQRILMETKNGENDYYRTSFDAFNCLICYKTFMTKGDLYDHQRKDHFESKCANRFACVRCVKKTTNFAQIPNDTNAMNSSTKSSVKENVFCTICDKSIKATAWSRHIRNHRDRVVYQCESCRKIRIGYLRFKNHFAQSPSCSDAMGMNNDKVDRESKTYIFQCEKCSEKFTRRSFKVHIEDSDCYVENTCKLCSKRFITKSALNEHRLVSCVKVEGELLFDCATCEKSFLTKQGLVRHSKFCRKSTEHKTMRCNICNILVESDASHWNEIHRRKPVVKLKRITNIVRRGKNLINQFTAGIQFGCLLCDDSFSDRSQLKVHMKVHYCDKSVQTGADDESELTLDLMDTDLKPLDAFDLKDEKIDSSSMAAEDDNKFQYSNEVVKTETTFNIENMWTTDSDHFDNLGNDDPVEMSDDTSNDVIQKNILGTTVCCLCKNVVSNLVNTDDVVEQQISRYGETVCLICFQLFNRSDKLREHERTHFQENLDGQSIACRSCAWSANAYYTDDDFFRLENDLQCYMCSLKMGDLRTLRRHKRSHLSLCVFTCKVCNKKSISDERHRNHLRKHLKPELAVVTNQIVRKCTMCGDEATHLFRDEKDIDRMFEKFGGGPCKICFTYITDKKRYISHERGHMDDQQLVSCFKCCNTKPYNDDEYHRLEDENACFICKAKLSSKYNLHLHKRKHLDRVVYSCTICSSLVVGTRNHSHHMYKHGHHKKNREEETGHFKCDYCQKVFPHKSSLPAHFKQHLNKQRVPCPQCTLTFASKGNLTQHIKQIHLNIRKHICELCGKAFGHPHNLKSHMVKHSGEKPYQCPICFKRFGYYSRMKSHAWIHSGLKPYKCDQCDKCYNDSTDLRRHKRIHGGVEKKFECELCKIKFYEHKYLRAHRASAHKFLVQ